MDVFEFREKLVRDYSDFTRSFTRIQAPDISNFVDETYRSQRYWPAPLVQVNPNFKPGHNVEELAQAGSLHPKCADIFRAGKTDSSHGTSLKLFKHQEEAISLAASGESYVLTTGTRPTVRCPSSTTTCRWAMRCSVCPIPRYWKTVFPRKPMPRFRAMTRKPPAR